MGFCVNCDNRHGCKNSTPVCQTTPYKKKNAGHLNGKKLMEELGELDRCQKCSCFKLCWEEGEYLRVKSKKR